MNKLVSRSLEILRNTAVDIGKDYTSNITSLVNDAQNVKNSIVKSTTDASDIYSKLKNTNITKKISDWFYDRESEADSSGSDEFDAGFKIESSDDHALDGDEKPKALNFESMSDISEKQTNAMFKIGRRQTEQTVANTAEIISTLNSRSSEMIASMNNINKTLMGISDRIDKLIQISTIESSNEPKEVDKGGLFSDGKLTLSGIFEASKQALTQNSVVSIATSTLQALQSGQLGPEALLSGLLKATVLDKKIDSFGGKSINDIGKGFNDMVGTITQTALSEILGSKYLKDVVTFHGDKDYGSMVQSHYDTKKAQFDGMTRMSIISVIPEYLNKINESLSGKTYHIDNSGKLVEGPRTNRFVEVTDHSFSSSGLSSKIFDKIEANAKKVVSPEKLSTEDINAAAKALTMSIVWDMHYKGQRLFRQSDLKRDMTPYIEYACSVLCRYKNDPQYWASICQTIVLQLSMGFMDSAQFVQNVNQSLQNMITAASEFAQSGDPSASQASRITFEMVSDRFLQQNFPGATKNNNTVTPTVSANTTNTIQSSTIVDGAIGNKNDDQKGKYSSYDYIRGIFGILNRGINVRTTNKPKNTKGYGNYPIERQSTDQIKDDEKFGDMMMGMMANSTGDDAKDMSSLITQGIKDATTSILGEEGANAASQAMGSGGGLSGFFGNMIGNLGASGMNKMFTRFRDGTLSKEVKAFFNEGGKGQKLANDVKGKLKSTKNKVMNNIPGELIYDRRAQEIGDAIVGEDGIVHNIADRTKNAVGTKTSQIWDKLNSNKKFSSVRDKTRQTVNNRLYRHDTNSFRRAEENLENITATDDLDSTTIEIVKAYIKRGDYDSALTASKSINNKQLKQVLTKNVGTLADVTKKRQAAETALANGETPDIGAVFDDSQIGSSSDKKGGIISVVKKGFSMVGKVLKQIAKLAGEGVMNITFGLKSMTEGLFGSKKRDKNGNVISNSGLIRNLTTDLYKATKSAIGNMPIAREGGMTVNEGIGKVKQGIKNVGTTIWKGREVGRSFTNDENGQLHSESIRKGGLSQMKITRSSEAKVEDLIKAPAQTLKQVMSDVGSSFKGFAEKHMPNFVKAFNWASKKIKKTADETSQKKGLFGRAGDAFRKTTFGSGFMSGFDEAKAAKKKLSEHAERMSSFPNRAIGNIMDVIMGKSNGKSAFTEICDLITGLRDDMNKNHKEDMNIQEDDDKKPDDDKSTSGSGTGQMKEEATETEASSKTSSGKGATKGFRAIGKEIIGNMGKMMGGFTQALQGIGQLVLSIVASLEGFQALKDMVGSILTDGLQPLNAIFESVMDLIKPIVDIMKGAVTTIADTIVTIAGSLISAIQPLMETLTPIIETMLDVLNPILDLFKVVADIIMVPLLIAVKAMQPIIESIGNVLTIMSGILQIGMGTVIASLGGIMFGVGKLVELVSLGQNDNLTKQGKSMMGQGADMIKGGFQQVVQGTKNQIELLGSFIPGGESPFDSNSTADEEKTSTSTDVVNNANVNGGAMGSGDVDNRVITQNSYVYNNTYGSGNRTTMNQHTYGSYMNMSERGCGPVALADAYSRRTGNNISPVSLASRMAGSGAYEPNRGTSVGSFIRTGNAMGMNMRVGGVTQASLKRATPNNPITLLGSGSDYGTRSGNDHYVNVIGTDRYGGAYVSNPLTGRVDRRSASTLALNSRLGLYGSGDSSDLFSFDANTTDAMTKLKNLTSRLTGMFTGESTSDSISRKINEGEVASQVTEIKRQLGDDFAESEKKAYDAFVSDNPKLDGETDEEYQARLQKKWSTAAIYNKYIADYCGQDAKNKLNKVYGDIKSGVSKFDPNNDKDGSFLNWLSTMDDLMKNDTSIGGVGSLSAENGAQLYDFGEITHKTTNITSTRSDESPLHDFFTATTGDHSYTDQGWFNKYRDPDTTGRGSNGESHGGVDFLWDSGSADKPLKATTGGVVVKSQGGGIPQNSSSNGGCGNNIMWKDSGGMYHWYMHLRDDPLKNVGDTIKAGELLGYSGNTGDCRGDGGGYHLHYTIRNTDGGRSSDSNSRNPLTYFSVYNSGSNLEGDTDEEKIWSYLIKNGATPISAAGFMGAWEVESSNDPNTLEGYYYFNGEKQSAEVQKAFKSNEDMDSYVTNELFPRYDTQGVKHNKSAYYNAGHYYPGIGLAQWTGSRSKSLADMANSMNSPWNDLGTQLTFWRNDVTGIYKNILDSTNATTSVDEATKIVLDRYEGNPGNKLSERQSAARLFYERYKDWVPSADLSSPTGNGSMLTGFGVVNSASDALMMQNANAIQTTSGKNTGTVATFDTGLNLRSQPTTDSPKLLEIPKGTVLDLEACDTEGWYKTTYNGKTGYVSANYISLHDSWKNDQQKETSIIVTKDDNPYFTNDMDVNGPPTLEQYNDNKIMGPVNYTDLYPQNMDSQEIIDKLYGDKDLSKRAERLALEKKIRNVIYDPSQWSTLEASERAILWDMLVDEHKKALNNVAYNGVYGNMTVTDHYYTGDDDEYWRYCYTTKDSRVNRQVEQMKKINNVAHSSGGGSHGGGLIGSGDVSSDFWYDSLFNNQSPFSQDIPPLDDTAFTDYDNTGLQPFRNIINRYEITSDDSNKTELLNKMSKMTFNVRAQRVEELLEELIEKVDGNKPKPTSNNSGTDLNLFKDNGIPEQVTRLSRG